MNKLKIILIGYNPQKLGGIESFSRNLKKNIFHKLHYLFEYDEKNDLYVVDDAIGVLPYNFFCRAFNRISSNRVAMWLMKRYLKNAFYDLYILNSPRYLHLVPELSKTILIQHTSVENWWRSKYKFNENKKLLTLAQKAGRVIALSEFDKLDINDRLNIPLNIIDVVHIQSPLELYSGERKKGRKLLMLSRFQNSIKRIDLAINAMRLLPDYTLDIYGDGIDKVFLCELAKKHPNVTIHPPTNDVVSVLDEHDIFIMTSNFEGYPVSAIEAISRKLPIIIRDTFLSAREIVDGNGVLLGGAWNEDEFVAAVHRCYENYAYFSKSNESLYNRYTRESVSHEWSCCIGTVLNLEHNEY